MAEVEELIEVALRRASMSLAELVIAVGLPAGEVSRGIEALAARRCLHNVGEADAPIWSWVVLELGDVVSRLLSERPTTLADLVAATGEPIARVVEVFKRVRAAAGVRLVDMTPKGFGLPSTWFLMPEGPSGRS